MKRGGKRLFGSGLFLIGPEDDHFKRDDGGGKDHIHNDEDDLPAHQAAHAQIFGSIAPAVDGHIQDVLAGPAHLLHGQRVAGVGDIVGGHVAVNQAAVTAVVDGAGGVHIAEVGEVVGEHCALEAPFAAQHIVQQVGASTRPLGANVVVRAHDGQRMTIGGTALVAVVLDADLKGLQVEFTHRLLGGPGGEHLPAARLLIVEGKVLDVGIHAVVRRALGGLRSDAAGQEAVLGVILKVTARKGSAVDIHGRGVPAGHVHVVGHGGDALAKGPGQVLIPGAGDHDRGGEAHGAHLISIRNCFCRKLLMARST